MERRRMPRTHAVGGRPPVGAVVHKLYGGIRLIQSVRDWPAWFRERAEQPADNRPARYRMRNGAVLHTRRNRIDLRLIDEIWGFRKYDYFGFKVAPGDIVVDVGANIGTFSLYAATEGRASRVIAFEPHPENFALLRQNVTENGLSTVTCHQAAIAGSPGTLSLQASPHTGSHRISSAPPLEGWESRDWQTIEVPCKTLAQVIDEEGLERIDYLKLDCEGAEYEILETASDEVLGKIRRISMECHRVVGHEVLELGPLLSEHGFTVRFVDTERMYAERTA